MRRIAALLPLFALALPILLLTERPGLGQVIESTGERALGMGGAFVAVADDSSATWWNPGALAAGPFVDVTISSSDVAQGPHTAVPSNRARSDRALSFAFTTPPLGVSWRRTRSAQALPPASIAAGTADRKDALTGIVTREVDASTLGITLVHGIAPGVHVGGTVKYVRGVARDARTNDVGRLSATAGDVQHRLDVDLGVLAVAGPVRIGGVVRNLLEPSFDVQMAGIDGRGGDRMRLPRQVRVGAAFAVVEGPAVVVAVDTDLLGYLGPTGDRRVVAAGAERWWWGRRFALRGGGRYNQVGRHERSATGGVSLAMRSGVYVEGHVVKGGVIEERGWGAGVRVTF